MNSTDIEIIDDTVNNNAYGNRDNVNSDKNEENVNLESMIDNQSKYLAIKANLDDEWGALMILYRVETRV